MKITVKRRELSAALATVTRAISAKSSLPLLKGVHFEIDPKAGTALLTATDIELWIQQKISVQLEQTLDDSIDEDATGFVLEGKHLSSMVAAMPDGCTITLTHTPPECKINVSWGTGSANIVSMPYEEFPGWPDDKDLRDKGAPEPTQFTMPGREIAQMIHLVRFALSKDTTRMAYTGARWRIGEGKLCIAGTDTHRLSIVERPCQHEEVPCEIIVPARDLVEIQSLGKITEEVHFTAYKRVLVAQFGDVRIASRLIEGVYPNVERVVPPLNEYVRNMRVERGALADIVRRALLVADDPFRRLTLTSEGDRLNLSAQSVTMGDLSESLEVLIDGGDKDAYRSCVNTAYLSEILSVLSIDGIRIQQESPLIPYRIESTETDGNDAGFVHVLFALSSRE